MKRLFLPYTDAFGVNERMDFLRNKEKKIQTSSTFKYMGIKLYYSTSKHIQHELTQRKR